ncbi:MAG: DNA-directed RNA polymerase subunit omega [Ignavibacteria bacterium RBG_13_36_8]|nr:MAG: DNA-directed RNA polymerase subunit omega [Ignavibacteria bacterium RBG_13_36_8]
MKVKPIELTKIDKHASNVYEGVIVAAKRARQINDDNRLEFSTLLNTMIGVTEDEFDEKENPERLRVSLEFENKIKPHLSALDELVNGKLEYSYKEKHED